MVYSVPKESKKLLHTAILDNSKIKVPQDIKNLASKVKFVGVDEPAYPVSLRFAESISTLKALEGLTLVDLIQKKYHTEVEQITINTDLAQGFLAPPPSVITFIEQDENGDEKIINSSDRKAYKEFYNAHFKDMDLYNVGSLYNYSSKSIYKTKDNRYYHTHGSLNPRIMQTALNIPTEENVKPNMSFEESWPIYQEAVEKFDAEELDKLANDVHKQAGTICYTREEFKQTEQYKANQHVGLTETHFINDGTPAHWWAKEDRGSVQRPLAGLKVLDITRIIAAPVITRTLAEYGASVMRVTSPNLPDLSALHAGMNAGKWTCELDFHKEQDLEKLQALIEEADVVVEGYRPFHLSKYGLGKENLLAMAKKRGRGIIYVRENCYGWNGPWAERIGWQQISDACCGISYLFGQSLGLDEPVTPVLPNSDFCTGAAGATAVIQALIDRSTKSGSYVIDAALNYYNTWLGDCIGTYEEDVWKKLWESKGKPVPRYYHNMVVMFPRFMALTKQFSPWLWQPDLFEERGILGTTAKLRSYKSVVHFSGETKPGFSIPARGNGADAPYWPEDLTVEKVV
ncbi:CoA-transferase family III domain-containing protein [Mucor lusitanicus]|uniref:CoA-transferase family III n=2 Tax=Mucor circinelloides f. lusitanicus TaxID=29924 RepID=A0A168L6H2_MUCCL|nr:CoA-transferase family III domain-containing protein [Mucor lusitanicus]OAD03163.1 hypothetical protein MUCCIDRAFT_142678 [Mucor lusitanicus CBS 277.49]